MNFMSCSDKPKTRQFLIYNFDGTNINANKAKPLLSQAPKCYNFPN